MNWALWRTQAAAIMRLEARKHFLSRRSWWIYALGLFPVALTAGHSLIPPRKGYWSCTLGTDTMVYAGIFQFFFLRLGIFFGSAGIFNNLFRGDVLERSQHYYLLAPVRREVLVLAKYLAGIVTSLTVFVTSALLSYWLIFLHFGVSGREYLMGAGGEHLLWYLATAAFACVGYGAFFLVAGMFAKNPMVPAGVLLVWEAINDFLPAVLQKISVIYYLKSLSPVEIPMDVRRNGPFAILANPTDPVPAWVAVLGLVVVVGVAVAYAAAKSKKLEIRYSTD